MNLKNKNIQDRYLLLRLLAFLILLAGLNGCNGISDREKIAKNLRIDVPESIQIKYYELYLSKEFVLPKWSFIQFISPEGDFDWLLHQTEAIGYPDKQILRDNNLPMKSDNYFVLGHHTEQVCPNWWRFDYSKIENNYFTCFNLQGEKVYSLDNSDSNGSILFQIHGDTCHLFIEEQ